MKIRYKKEEDKRLKAYNKRINGASFFDKSKCKPIYYKTGFLGTINVTSSGLLEFYTSDKYIFVESKRAIKILEGIVDKLKEKQDD